MSRAGGDRKFWSILKIRLRPGIALAFLVVVIPLNVGMVAFVYHQTAALAFEMADVAMQHTSLEVTAKIKSLLAPVGQAVDAMASLARLDGRGLRHVDSQAEVFRMLLRLPEVTSLYAGFESDGAFYQDIRLRPDLDRLGPELGRVPAGARYVLRRLDSRDGRTVDAYSYLRAWGQEVGAEIGPVRYDPRQRGWYRSAMAGDGLTISDVYVFSGTGALGLTVSERIVPPAPEMMVPPAPEMMVPPAPGEAPNRPVGVVGADLSLQTLSKFLDQRRVGEHGVVFIMDEEGRLIGHPRADLEVSRDGEAIGVVKAGEASDPVVADAVRKRNGGAGDHFRDRLGPGGEEFLVQFHPLPSSFGRAWTIGIAAPVVAFVGPLQRASLVFLALGALLILVAVLAAIVLSRLLTRPMQALIQESERIRQFDLAERPVIHSGIVDVDTLADSVHNMKSGLRSFGAYVPKELVRHIVASGTGTEVGGSRRPLTILFSDIKDFTSISEALAPEEVLERLSQYFDVMSRAIHQTGGVVDKFIGDGLMAIWNAPTPDEDHAAKACRAVLACMQAEDTLSARFVAAGYRPLASRFGLHTGTAVIGNVGSLDRMQYTALGAVVNLASRVESLNRTYGTRCLITGPVEAAVRGRFLVRLVDVVIPAGTSLPTPLFELVGPGEGAPSAAVARCHRWDEAFAAYRRRDWPRAIEAFQDYLAASPDEPAALLLLERCRRYLSRPPPADWDGAVRFENK